jgi:hypothetical protein
VLSTNKAASATSDSAQDGKTAKKIAPFSIGNTMRTNCRQLQPGLFFASDVKNDEIFE